MLSEDQIDYLLQIKETKPAISDSTVQIMLEALRWDPKEIERGIAFLNRPYVKTNGMLASMTYLEPVAPALNLPKPIIIKQHPFPIGSPFVKHEKHKQNKKHKQQAIAGAIFGGVLFVVGVIVYARLTGAGF
ncbi:MAG: hypothetical protein Q7S86_03430 [bacterium]|nr:hypothetical protein [bacterium]